MIRLYTFCGILLLFNISSIYTQKIRFNEVMAANSILFDEDGDTPDWLELHNLSSQNISLEGWTISDEKEFPQKWRFPNIDISPNTYLPIWASGKDRLDLSFVRTFISQLDTFKYLLPNSAVNPQWITSSFDDEDWVKGLSGFGYGDNDDQTDIPPGSPSIFLRIPFYLVDINIVQQLILDIDYDDGFVAYINGQEIARANIIGSPPAFDAGTITDHEANIYQGGQPDRFIINNPENLLQEGKNILCIQVHNISRTSSDMTAIPFLSAVFSTPSQEGIMPPKILKLLDRRLHTNFKISSKKETLYLYNASENLVDSILIENLPSNVSLGISADGNKQEYYTTPTPGEINSGEGFIGTNQTVITFSHQGGLINDNLSLSLEGTESTEMIRYTVDATIPNDSSPIYDSPIPINRNTVIRARVFRPGYIPSNTQTRTYLANVSHSLPIITLVTEPRNFFDLEYGIYVHGQTYQRDFPYFGSNFWNDWERPIHFSLYEEDGSLGVAFDAGTKIFGGWSRGNEQRSLSIFARNQYGIDEIHYPLFPGLPFDKFQAFVLRNSGNDWINTMLRDGALTGLMKGTDLDFQAYRPTATYINGEYWGIYNMREKVNEHFLASRHNLDIEELDILEADGETIYGDNQSYLQLIDFISSKDLTLDENYKYVSQQIDIDNYATYQAAQIYFDNTDWPGNNIKYWKVEGGKWRWILYDTDFGFGIWNPSNYQNNTLSFALEPNGNSWPNPSWSTLLFRKLTENLSFRNTFVNRFADFLNSRFLPNKVDEHIDTLAANIVSEIPNHYGRWDGSTQYWTDQIENMKAFAYRRPSIIKSHILRQFGLSSFHTLNIKNDEPAHGYIQVNSLRILENAWNGDYFEDVPIKLIAIPESGYTFSHWEGDYNSSKEELEINLQKDIILTAFFRKSTTEDEQVVINEINYRSSDDFDTGDWIELHNRTENYINISGWEIRDNNDDNRFILPPNTVIPSKDYLIIVKDTNKFRRFYADMKNVTGNMPFGLSSLEDAVRLFDSAGLLRDEVVYSSGVPWPTEANGSGATVELVDPYADNSLSDNWKVLHEFGSPGVSNLDDTLQVSTFNIEYLTVYPNPFQDKINITFQLKEPSHVSVSLYDIRGVNIKQFVDKKLEAGEYHLVDNLQYLATGMYFLEIKDDKAFLNTFRWLKVGEN